MQRRGASVERSGTRGRAPGSSAAQVVAPRGFVTILKQHPAKLPTRPALRRSARLARTAGSKQADIQLEERMAHNTRLHSLVRGASIGTALVAVISIAAPALAASKSVVKVTSAANAGPGSFREAVETANGDDRIKRIRFDKSLFVGLTESVVYTGEQNLEIDGKGSTLSGAGGDAGPTPPGTAACSSPGVPPT